MEFLVEKQFEATVGRGGTVGGVVLPFTSALMSAVPRGRGRAGHPGLLMLRVIRSGECGGKARANNLFSHSHIRSLRPRSTSSSGG